MLVVCALHNFIRHRANGEEDRFYKEIEPELLGEAGNTNPSSDMYGGIENTSQTLVGQSREMREMVVERDKRATKMWIDYVNYTNSSDK